MYLELIPEAGKFYKANMHCHTVISDGQNTPEEVKEIYKQKGYSAVCFTDHELFVTHKDLCDESFIALHGYELAIAKSIPGSVMAPAYHINLIAKSQNTERVPLFCKNKKCFQSPYYAERLEKHGTKYDQLIDEEKYDVEWLNNHIGEFKKAGFLAVYNHPQWSQHNAYDYLGLTNLHGVELINGGDWTYCDNTATHYEQLLRAGVPVVATAGDDNHQPALTGRAWTMIKAPELSYDALMKAYEAGHCYASEGPEIHSVVLKDGKLCVKTSPASFITVPTEGRCIPRRGNRGGPAELTEACFDFNPQAWGRFFRVEVWDEKGFRAFSSAFYTADILKKLEEQAQ
ncbi:MAG: hypothetical protein IJY22_02215 [Clostridia bacterium]|nr:hypothetical protein [Clostridia bacterium]